LVKQRFVAENRDHLERCVLAVVPARADKLDGTKLPLIEFGGETLLHHCIAKLAGIDLIDRIVVSTDDPAVAEAAISAGAEVPVLRPMHSAMGLFENALLDLLHRLQVDEGYELDIVAIVHPHSPFLRREQIIEAVDTMLIYDTDSVIAVVEDLTYHWQVGRNGLTPVGYQKRVLRQEKDLIYKEAGSLYVIKAPKFIATGDLLGRVIGHIEVQPYDAVRVQTAYDRWVAERMTEGWRPA
jgi:CMP-N-acetylneuraminic acid synthetase